VSSPRTAACGSWRKERPRDVPLGRRTRRSLGSRASGAERGYERGDEHQVTRLQLFFDLVSVFAFIQVTSLLTADPTWRGVLPGCSFSRGSGPGGDTRGVASTIDVDAGMGGKPVAYLDENRCRQASFLSGLNATSGLIRPARRLRVLPATTRSLRRPGLGGDFAREQGFLCFRAGICRVPAGASGDLLRDVGGMEPFPRLPTTGSRELHTPETYSTERLDVNSERSGENCWGTWPSDDLRRA
jgi:hypothetical protein